MASEINLNSYIRARLFKTALVEANQQLKSHRLAVGFILQLSKIKEEVVNFDSIDQMTDFDLALYYNKRWMRIDVVYFGPKKPTSVEELSQDIYEKAIDHLEAMRDETVFISSMGTKYNTAHLKTHTLEIDAQGYLRVNGLRIVRKKQQMYRPEKATQFRSHTRITPQELTDDVLNLTERIEESPTNRKKGVFCVTKKAQFIAIEKIVPRRQVEAAEYEDGQYIPLVWTWREVQQLFAGTSDFFNE